MNRRAFLRSLCVSPIAAAASVAGLAAAAPAIGAGRQYATGEGGPEFIGRYQPGTLVVSNTPGEPLAGYQVL